MKDQEPRRRVEFSRAEPRCHAGDSDTLTAWHLTFGCFGDDVTLRCNWQSVIPRTAAPDCSIGWGPGLDSGTWGHLGGQVASRLPSSNTSLPCPAPVSKGPGGAQQCFVFLYKTNDVSQTHEPHHTSPITTAVNTNTNSSNVTTKYHCGAHAHATRRRGCSPTVPGPAQASSSFLVYLLPTCSSAV